MFKKLVACSIIYIASTYALAAVAGECPEYPESQFLTSDAKVLVPIIQKGMPNVTLDPSYLYFEKKLEGHLLILNLEVQTVNGTTLVLDGFNMIAKAAYDSEGNITSCNLALWMGPNYAGENIVIRAINNKNTGVNLISQPINLNRPVWDLDYQYLP